MNARIRTLGGQIVRACAVVILLSTGILAQSSGTKNAHQSEAKTYKINLTPKIECRLERSDNDKLEALSGRVTKVRCPLAVDDPTARSLAVQADLLRRSGLKGVKSDSDLVLEAIISEKPEADRWQTMIDRMTRRYGSASLVTPEMRLWTEQDDFGLPTRKIVIIRRGRAIEYYWVNTEFERLHLGGEGKLLDQLSAKLK